ncbi:hypothetical protein SNE40_021765 [Patella caerulea]|uniref:Tudor domain-containing protein n=1 Tax=Patella caerulea TaxID=87958 RepID=A0AAN8G0P1_PATCE
MGSSTVAFKETSCYCEICLNDNLCENPSWIKQDMTAKKPSKEIAVISIPEKEINDCNVTQVVKVRDGDFVAAVYGDEWFIGQVVQVDQDDEEIEVKFMHKKKQCYQWPIREDIIWVKPQDIICGRIKTSSHCQVNENV